MIQFLNWLNKSPWGTVYYKFCVQKLIVLFQISCHFFVFAPTHLLCPPLQQKHGVYSLMLIGSCHPAFKWGLSDSAVGLLMWLCLSLIKLFCQFFFLELCLKFTFATCLVPCSLHFAPDCLDSLSISCLILALLGFI